MLYQLLLRNDKAVHLLQRSSSACMHRSLTRFFISRFSIHHLHIFKDILLSSKGAPPNHCISSQMTWKTIEVVCERILNRSLCCSWWFNYKATKPNRYIKYSIPYSGLRCHRFRLVVERNQQTYTSSFLSTSLFYASHWGFQKKKYWKPPEL